MQIVKILPSHAKKGVSRYEYQLSRKEIGGRSFLESNLQEGDPIVVTCTLSSSPVGVGYIVSLHADTVVLSSDKPLEDFKSENKYTPLVPSLDAMPNLLNPSCVQMTFNVDKDVYTGGNSLVRSNLYRLFQSAHVGLMRHIVEGRIPNFNTHEPLYLASEVNLSEGQISAIQKIVAANDFAMLLGMPGTGKTTTVVGLIRELLARGKTVLLCAYTHSAVDNVLMKLIDNVPFIRLGTMSKVLLISFRYIRKSATRH